MQKKTFLRLSQQGEAKGKFDVLTNLVLLILCGFKAETIPVR